MCAGISPQTAPVVFGVHRGSIRLKKSNEKPQSPKPVILFALRFDWDGILIR